LAAQEKMLRRIALRYGTQLVLVVAPMMTLNWSVLDLFGFFPKADSTTFVDFFWITAQKQQIELGVRIVATVAAVGASLRVGEDQPRP
jgi:hypothetical protein